MTDQHGNGWNRDKSGYEVRMLTVEREISEVKRDIRTVDDARVATDNRLNTMIATLEEREKSAKRFAMYLSAVLAIIGIINMGVTLVLAFNSK